MGRLPVGAATHSQATCRVNRLRPGPLQGRSHVAKAASKGDRTWPGHKRKPLAAGATVCGPIMGAHLPEARVAVAYVGAMAVAH
ncbi:hypothetical protein BHM03_00042304 [Ensete ventricosum]|nr:hypothetical protein BHM03_00042304 [Ensete ventricosum]